jgi:hypothetical protein
MTTSAIIALLVFASLLALIWKRSGLGAGRAFGNRIANHLGIPKNLFHSLLENGVTGPSLSVLATLERAGLSLEQASVELGPSLARGANRLEARFGHQKVIEDAKPTISALVTQWEAKQESNETT